jgi:hypothetical protein
MTQPTKIAALLLTLAVRHAAAQSGYVVNAVGSQSSQINVLAPRMLATVSEFPVYSGIILLRSLSPAVSVTADVFIRPAGSVTSVPAQVIATGSGSATFLVPANVPLGTAELIWRIGDEPFQWINVTVARTNFEFSPSQYPLGLAAPARPGQVVSLTGSGLGIETQVSATLGGSPAKVISAGPGSATGYDQIQVEIPAATAVGCYVPLTLAYGENSVSSLIPVTKDGAPCAHPSHLSPADLKNLDAGLSIAAASVNLSTTLNATLATAAYRSESAGVYTDLVKAADLARDFGPSTIAPGCMVNSEQNGFSSFGYARAIADTQPQPPDLGKSVTLRTTATTLVSSSTSGYFYFDLPAPQDGNLSILPANIVSPGRWTLLTGGSTDLPPSSFDFTLPAPVRMYGSAPMSLRRDQDQTILWNGAAFDPNAVATLFLNGHGSGTPIRNIVCTAQAGSGSITIPAALLAPYAPTSTGSISLQITAPVQAAGSPVKTASGGTLVVIVFHLTRDARPVDFQ